jgi:hypothetical protein
MNINVFEIFRYFVGAFFAVSIFFMPYGATKGELKTCLASIEEI